MSNVGKTARTKWLLLLGVLLSVAAVAQPVVVELFTSEGCSSCPPAEVLLGELARKPGIVALAYHVDYWDHLGWKDRFSIPEASQRQQGYVRRLAKSGPFTPQVVVSGDTSLVGSNRAAVKEAIAGDRDALAIMLSKAEGNLQGLWNDMLNPPWGSKYTININTEMNYWPAEPTALGECVEPLIEMVKDLAVTGAQTAKTMYGARGWVVHHNTDLWRATAPIDSAKNGMWPTGGAWLCLHLWDRYDYSRDVRYLESIYPILKSCAEFFLDTLVKHPNGQWLVTNPSMSPENKHLPDISIAAGPAMDNQILRDLFANTAQAASILGRDAEFVASLHNARRQLPPDQIGAQGQLQEWLEDWDAKVPDIHHRHISHLYGVFPSGQISVDHTPKLANAARQTLDIRGDEATGWGLGWRLNLWARLRDGERAHRILKLLLGPERTYPNLFDAHPPFQIDGNFGGTSGITEMLLQSLKLPSGEDEILLLPALPSAWPNGSISGLRARGGLNVDLRWKNGLLDECRLTAIRNGKWRIRLHQSSLSVSLAAGRSQLLSLRDGLLH